MWTRFWVALTCIHAALIFVFAANLWIDVTSVVLKVAEWDHAHVECVAISKVSRVRPVIFVYVTYTSIVPTAKITSIVEVTVERRSILIIRILLIRTASDAVLLIIRIVASVFSIRHRGIAFAVCLVLRHNRLLVVIVVVAHEVVVGAHLVSSCIALIRKTS